MSKNHSAPPAGWRLAAGAHSGRARGFLRFWPFWEWVMGRIQPKVRIPQAEGSLFWVHFMRYHGRPIALPDGTQVGRGDLVAEIHVRNRELAAISDGASPWGLLRRMTLDLRALAAWAQASDFPAGVRAVYGMTLLGRAAPRLGFTLRPPAKHWYSPLERFYLLGLIALYHPRGVERLPRGTTYNSSPQETWMSRQELIRRFSAATSRR